MYDPDVHVGVAVVITDHMGKSLLMKRGEGVSHGAGLWSVPGGWIDIPESPEEAAIREVKEELGITLPESDLMLVDAVSNSWADIGHVICLFYEAIVKTMPEAKIMEPEKCSELKLMDYHDLKSLEHHELFPPFRDYLKKVWG